MPNSPPSRHRFPLLAAWLVTLLSSAVFAAAQIPAALSHQAWSTEEGLPEASVHQILQSRDGYLWLATGGGVVRFDGIAFQILRHETQPAFASDDISSIAQDTAGNLWFGTSDGLVRNSGAGFQRFTEHDGLPSSTVLSLAAIGDGGLLILTTGGLVRYDGASFQPLASTALSTSGTVNGLDASPNGSVSLLTSDAQFIYEHGVAARLAQPFKLPERILGLQFSGRLSSGSAHEFGAWTAHHVALSTTAGPRVLEAGKELPQGRITALYLDREGTAWIGTTHGLFREDIQTGATPRPVEALLQDSILSILEDREGNLWVGTEASGLHALRPRKFRSEPAAAGEAITSVVTASDGAVWLGTRDDGVRVIRHDNAETPLAASALTSPVVLSLAPGHHGDLWVGTPDGLNHVDGKHTEQFTSATGLPDDFVRSLLVDSHDVVWAGTRRGLARLDHGQVTTLTQADGLASDSIGALLETKLEAKLETRSASASAAGLWVGTSAGLSHLHDGHIENFAAGIVTALAQGSGDTLWVGLHAAGLSRFRDGRFTAIHAETLPTEITSLLVDSSGFLWLRSAQGVARVAVSELDHCADNAGSCNLQAGSYGVADGMPSSALTAEGSPQLWQSGSALWIATRKGLAVTDTLHVPLNTTPPPVVVQSFAVDDREVPRQDGEADIPAGHNRYVFNYAALSYTLPSKNRYRTMLEGFDRSWIDAGTARAAYYTSLPPGHYTFRVQAQNNDGVWNETGAAVRFHVLPPFYRRWWFYLLLAAVIAAAALSILRLREHTMKQRFALVLNERNRVAREVHDTLAQDFVSVSLQIDIAASLVKTGQVDAAATQLQETRKLVKNGLEEARQSIWNLRANAAENSLPARLTALVQRESTVGQKPHLKIGGVYRKLPAAIEDEILRIAQEGLSNITRHAEAQTVSVHLHYDSNSLQLMVRDDGRGFSPEEAAKLQGHYGLRGMKERAANLHATLTMESTPGEGTTVTLRVPLSAGEKQES
ncbi:MAG TPA: two-component regulator propeller domain-containing protein [Acidobacteriaceae bacterium]